MRNVVGTMTGTSMDGVDAVAVTIEGYGLDMVAEFCAIATTDLGDARPLLRSLASIGGSAEELNIASRGIGELTLNSIRSLQMQDIDLIALHGQTIYHKPPTSMQLIDPKPITDAFDCTVLTDPRQQDLALGGQGAPITPLADWIMFRDPWKSTAIVNLGGFCNISCMPTHAKPNDVTGFDVCACNLLLNTVSQQLQGMEYDIGGAAASTGNPCGIMSKIVKDKLHTQRVEQRSLGTNDDLGEFILSQNSLPVQDLLASIVLAIGECINEATELFDRVLVAGGGVHNQALIRHIRHDGTTALCGVPVQAREGMAMAILGALAEDGVSITLPQITGRQETTEVVGWTHAKP